MPFKFNAITGSLDLVNASSGGDVVGPASATDNAVARFDGTTGKLIKNSGVIIDNSNNVTGVNELNTTAKIEVGDPGSETAGIDIAGTIYATKLRVNDIGGSQDAQQIIHRHSTTLPAALVGARANSNTSSHLDVTNNQVLFRTVAVGYAGSNYKAFAYIDYLADTGTISNTSAPGRLEFYTTPNSSLTPTLAMTIGSTQLVSFANGLSVTGNIAVTGTVDGVDVSALNSAYNSHVADASIHFTQGSISIPSTQISDFTEAAQDAVFNAIADSGTIDFTYNDAGNSFTGSVIQSGILASSISAGTFANGSVIFSNGTNLAQDNTNFFFDNTNDQLSVGYNATGAIIAGGFNPSPKYFAYTDSVLEQGFASISNENTNAASFNGYGIYRSRGTLAAPLTVVSGDLIGAVNWYGRDSTDYQYVAGITVSTIGTIGAGSIPSTMAIATSSGSTLVNAITINQNQLTSVLKGMSVSGGQVDITPTEVASNQPYSFLIDHEVTNLIVNPSFENNITDGWAATGVSTNTRDTTEKWIGTASLKIVSSAALGGVVSSAIPVSFNTQYVVSCYIKGAVGGENFNIRVTKTSGNVNLQTTGATSIETYINTEWSRVTLGFTTGAADATVTVSLTSRTAVAQTIYIDGVMLEQKNFPTDTGEQVIASSYCDGSMGVGYAWTGTANNSTSTRTAGAKFLAPITTTANRGNFVMRTDGTVARMMFDAKEVQPGNFAGTRAEPFFPFTFTGRMKDNVLDSGISSGIVNIKNLDNGTALQVSSQATAAFAFLVSAEAITSGACMGVFAPADLTAMQAAGGKFFTFAGKGAGLDMYTWKVDEVYMGALGFAFKKNIIAYGGASMTGTVRAIAGTVSVTNASPTVTVASGFLTNFKRGQHIGITNGTAAFVTYTIASIESDTSLTLTTNYAGTTNAARTYESRTLQYAPPVLHLEGNYGNHGSGLTGDFMYGLYASGGAGQLRVMRSAALGVAVTPTADHDGHGLVTARQVLTNAGLIFGVATETTMISGYTIKAYELTPGGSFRISFVGLIVADNILRTLTWRVKLGGTTILTSTAVQVGLVGTIPYRAVIDIYVPTETSQIVSLSIVGKDQASLLPGLTYSVNNLTTTGTRDMRLDQALTVTCQADAAGQVVAVSGVTTEIL